MNGSTWWPAIHEVDLLATIVEAKQDEANLLCAPFTLADERVLRDFGHISLGRYLNFMSRPVMKARNGEESEKRKHGDHGSRRQIWQLVRRGCARELNESVILQTAGWELTIFNYLSQRYWAADALP